MRRTSPQHPNFSLLPMLRRLRDYGAGRIRAYYAKGGSLIWDFSTQPGYGLIRDIQREEKLSLTDPEALLLYNLAGRLKKVTGEVAEVGVYKGARRKSYARRRISRCISSTRSKDSPQEMRSLRKGSTRPHSQMFRRISRAMPIRTSTKASFQTPRRRYRTSRSPSFTLMWISTSPPGRRWCFSILE